jgi:hypothetical protein
LHTLQREPEHNLNPQFSSLSQVIPRQLGKQSQTQGALDDPTRLPNDLTGILILSIYLAFRVARICEPLSLRGVEPLMVRVVENEGRALGAKVGELKNL